jgi:hypothetical protein
MTKIIIDQDRLVSAPRVGKAVGVSAYVSLRGSLHVSELYRCVSRPVLYRLENLSGALANQDNSSE